MIFQPVWFCAPWFSFLPWILHNILGCRCSRAAPGTRLSTWKLGWAASSCDRGTWRRQRAKEEELIKDIEELTSKAEKCDKEEDDEYQDKTGYEIPEELKIKEKRLAKIKEAEDALEKREQELNPGKMIENKKQISFYFI